MNNGYNPIFEKLVLNTDQDSSDRLIGMLAYAEYKLQKQEYYRSYHSEHGSCPDDGLVNEFVRRFNDRILEKQKKDATETLISFAEALTAKNLEENISELIDNSIISEIKDHNSKTLSEVKSQNAKMTAFYINISSSLAFSFLVFIVAAAIQVRYPDSLIGKIFTALTDNTIELTVTKKKTE